MTKNFDTITTALAGVFGASYLTNQLATTGHCDQRAFDSAMHSILSLDASHIRYVYEGKGLVNIGLTELIRVFSSGFNKGNSHISRYVISAIHLEKVLSDNGALKNRLRQGIVQAQNMAKTIDPSNEIIIRHLASVYRQNFGQMKFRIAITGSNEFLHDEEVVAKCRCLLFAAIRSAVLWRQVGGTRWQLFLNRRKLRQTAEVLL